MNSFAAVGGILRGWVLGVVVLVALIGLCSLMKQKNARLWKWTLIVGIGTCFFLVLYEHVLLDYIN